MTQKSKKTKRHNRTKINFALDIVLALTFVFGMEVYFTGIPLHELLGLFFAVGLIVHLLLHWDWIVALTRTFFKKLLHQSRVNYVLNAALLIVVVAMTLSGIVISQTLGLSLPMADSTYLTWSTVHALSAQLVLVLVALHIAMHWRWIVINSKKYLFIRPNTRQQRVSSKQTPFGRRAIREQAHE